MPDKFKPRVSLLLCVLAALPALDVRAELRLGRPFGDHMVVQRDVELPVWGKADAGKTVVVHIGEEKQTTVANKEGDWRVAFPAYNATDRRLTIEVQSGTTSLTVSDVLVGERLARWALAKTYGRKDVVASGPLYRSMRIDGRRIVLEFDYVGTGLQTRDGLPLRYFEIAGADGKFHPAEASIENGAIVVSSDAVGQPSQVRYGWIPFPEPPVNFCNREDLPASPFTTLKEGKQKN